MSEEAAAAFAAMAERIGRVAEDEFGGAVVIVPPGEERAIVFLLTDPAPDAVQFFAAVKSRVEIAYAELGAAAESRRGGWG